MLGWRTYNQHRHISVCTWPLLHMEKEMQQPTKTCCRYNCRGKLAERRCGMLHQSGVFMSAPAHGVSACYRDWHTLIAVHGTPHLVAGNLDLDIFKTT